MSTTNWYLRYLDSLTWQRRRARFLETVAAVCEKCGRYGTVEVHHRSYADLGAEPDRDLMALCADCHARQHPNKRRWNELKSANDNQPQLPLKKQG